MSKPDRQFAPKGRMAWFTHDGDKMVLVEGCAFAGYAKTNGSFCSESRLPNDEAAQQWIARAKQYEANRPTEYNDGTPFPRALRWHLLTVAQVNEMFAERDAAQEVAA